MVGLGHFSSVCRSHKRNTTQARGAVSYVVDSKDIAKPCDQISEMNKGFMVSIIDCAPNDVMKSPKSEFYILGEKLMLMVDSGSPWTIITQQYCQEKLSYKIQYDNLQPSDKIAESFDGTKIEIEGFFQVELQFKTRCAMVKLYIALKGVNLVGWRDQYKLGLILNPRSSEPVSLCNHILLNKVAVINTEIDLNYREDKLISKYDKVFCDKLGKLKNFSHKIVLKENVIPVK